MDKKQQPKPSYLIGIDPGINNGIAYLDTNTGKLIAVTSCNLHTLFNLVLSELDKPIFVYIENPNTWVPFKNVSMEVMEMRRSGAGAVKQTYRHIIEFLEDHGIEYRPTRLQGSMKKVSSEWFKKFTGWAGKTNQHGRDAAMLVYGRM
ncbi:MAG TPA: hypothetical protein PKC38_04245 [Chitinophagales bacterium]|nr:hypothetical protein [Chitinophagales bacterium]HMX77146.1 hypothetical protein [Chitinophagaceae bacterium]HNA14763.1 hypothetical protein [Cyclobacteriaceae bacterium]HNC13941.1 hypothetical protein [Cyclobacteriaceae bacterium]HNH32167.1 hypothetical protein [bacterium]